MLIGRDDTAAYSQAHREAREMDILVNELPKEKIRFFAGADQLGLLLLSRAANRLQYELPLVNVTYAVGKGGKTVPTYEDDTVAVSAKQHIYAAGAFPVYSRKNADLVLAVNTPADGVTHEASDASNSYKALPATVNFVNKVESILKHNHPVIVADIRFGNGADNALIKTLFDKQLAYRLASYGRLEYRGQQPGLCPGAGPAA